MFLASPINFFFTFLENKSTCGFHFSLYFFFMSGKVSTSYFNPQPYTFYVAKFVMFKHLLFKIFSNKFGKICQKSELLTVFNRQNLYSDTFFSYNLQFTDYNFNLFLKPILASLLQCFMYWWESVYCNKNSDGGMGGKGWHH